MMAAQPAQSAAISTEQARPWARLTAAAGIACVALTIVGLILPGADPSPTSSLESIRAHFADNRTGVLTGQYLQGLGMLCLLAFAVGLGGLVHRGGADPLGILGRLMLAGAVGNVAVLLACSMAAAALAYRVAAAGEAGAVQALFYFYMMIPLSGLPTAAFLAPAAVGILRSGIALRWLGWVALPPALCLLVGAAAVGDLYGPLSYLGYLGGGMPFLLWMLAISIVLLVRARATAPATGGHAVSRGGERWQPES